MATGRAEMLQSLHESAAHNAQVEAWRVDRNAFDSLKADFEDQLGRVRWEAYQVATMYAAFQGAIFSAISQANLLTCELWWSPFALSVAVSVATFLAIADKLHSIGKLKEDILETDLNIAAILDWEDKIEYDGITVDLETAQPRQERPRNEHAGWHCIASKGGIFALVLLIFFSILTACFSRDSLCRHCTRCT